MDYAAINICECGCSWTNAKHTKHFGPLYLLLRNETI